MVWMAPWSSRRLQSGARLESRGAKAINFRVRANSGSRSGTPSAWTPTAGVHFAILPQLTGFLTKPFVLSCANSLLLWWCSAQKPHGRNAEFAPRLSAANPGGDRVDQDTDAETASAPVALALCAPVAP